MSSNAVTRRSHEVIRADLLLKYADQRNSFTDGACFTSSTSMHFHQGTLRILRAAAFSHTLVVESGHRFDVFEDSFIYLTQPGSASHSFSFQDG